MLDIRACGARMCACRFQSLHVCVEVCREHFNHRNYLKCPKVAEMVFEQPLNILVCCIRQKEKEGGGLGVFFSCSKPSIFTPKLSKLYQWLPQALMVICQKDASRTMMDFGNSKFPPPRLVPPWASPGSLAYRDVSRKSPIGRIGEDDAASLKEMESHYYSSLQRSNQQ
ncbi:hypothetical protein E3N88_20526 [Mikania micrantha]|uniref:Uncharacterized protein n=1 Tax=Mikania micrantha TaxID=192012 RepID=A0A5N6NJ39_9ASTR|nr:hypothetical protein E3N88_20526 [Mikania micrantha]